MHGRRNIEGPGVKGRDIMLYITLFVTFFKIGAFTIGGGYAMLPLIQDEVVRHGWMASEDLINFLAISESTPGPFSINVSTYIGMQTGGILGALCATTGVVMPSFIIIMLLCGCYKAYNTHPCVQGALSGLRPAATALIAASAVSIFIMVFAPFFNGANPSVPVLILSLAVFIISSVGGIKKIHPIAIIAFSAAAGILLGAAGLI